MKKILLTLTLLFPLAGFAQYGIDWFALPGGGGTSSGGAYTLSGSIGQPEASAANALTGGSYALTGGFWSLISVVQTPGQPNLTISQSGHSVIISWPATAGGTLQQNANLANASGWVTSSYPVTTLDGISSITITPPVGNLFFRLKVD